MIYCCEKCQKEFSKKSNYLTHINRKISCLKEEQDQYKILKKTCSYCVNVFSSPCAMKTHMNTCTKKPSKEDELAQVIINLNNELKEIKEKLNNPTVTNNNITNITNNNTNNTLVQIIVPYGEEDLSFLTINDYKRIFNKGCFSIPELISIVHCNEAHPECMNIYIKNLKDDYILIHDGNEWMIKEKSVVFDNILMRKKVFLEDKFEDYYAHLSFVEKQVFKKFLERYDVDEVINNIKLELKMMLYNNRKAIPKKPTKKIKQIENVVNENKMLENVPKNDIQIEDTKTNNQNEKKPKKKITTK
jgi:hypothetical protein